MEATKLSASAACTHHRIVCAVTAPAGVMPKAANICAVSRPNGLNTVNHGMS